MRSNREESNGIARGVKSGIVGDVLTKIMQPTKHFVIGGLEAIPDGLERLWRNEGSGVKLVVILTTRSSRSMSLGTSTGEVKTCNDSLVVRPHDFVSSFENPERLRRFERLRRYADNPLVNLHRLTR